MTAERYNRGVTASPLQPGFRYAFWLFVGAISFSVAGLFVTKAFPSSMAFFGPYYADLVKAPTWTYMAVLPLLPITMYARSLGWPRMILFLIWGCAIGGASELMGTMNYWTVGGIVLPFGAYEYTHWLGPKIAGHVPYFIPLSWFAMSIISLDLAYRVASSRWSVLLTAAAFMTLWDVSLDPAMNYVFPFWQYGTEGFFYGMPLSNWVGWFIVSFLIMLSYELMGGLEALSRWAPWVYVLNCAFPLMISALHATFGAVAFGVMATAVPFVAIWLRRQRQRKAPASAVRT
jgi:putative membrane protein